jgi:hypothetical protein
MTKGTEFILRVRDSKWLRVVKRNALYLTWALTIICGAWTGYALSGHKLVVSIQWSEVRPEDYKK